MFVPRMELYFTMGSLRILIPSLRKGQSCCYLWINRGASLILGFTLWGHLLDISMRNVGLGHSEPSKSYHFPEGPYVEYKGAVPQIEWESKRKELELDINKLISGGGKVYVAILPYEEASELCDGCLPDYVPKGSTPRIVRFGDSPGCPCGGTHVSEFSELVSMKVNQIRTKKGLTKVFYNVGT